MSIVYSTALKNTRMQAVQIAIDAGSGPGVLEIGTSGMATVLATIPFNDPCAPAASGGVLTFSTSTALQDTSADATGTAAAARFKDSTGTVVASGLTVGTSGADINLISVSLVAGQIVQINSAAITHG